MFRLPITKIRYATFQIYFYYNFAMYGQIVSSLKSNFALRYSLMKNNATQDVINLILLEYMIIMRYYVKIYQAVTKIL